MINIFPLRAGLLTAALLLTTAMGAPSMAASLPELSPRQIASDVKMSHNPQTGVREFIAPSFDPFEDDRELAGTAQLRSAANEVTIDGQNLRGGAMLDLTFYYNSGSADPYDNRGYGDAVFLSGDYAPITRRDGRVLECSEQVSNVVYYHEDYYAPSFYLNLYRPYRHYSGFNSFGRNGYGGYSSFGYAGGNYARGSSRGNSRRVSNGNRTRGHTGTGRNRNTDHRDRSGTDNANRDRDRVRNNETRRSVTESERGLALGRRTDGDTARRRNQNARNVGMSPRVGSRMNRRLENNETVRSQGASTTPRVTSRATPRAERRVAAPAVQAAAPVQSAPAQTSSRQATPQRSTSQRTTSSRSESRARNTRDRVRNEVNSSSRAIKSRNSPRLSGKRIISLSSMTSFFGRNSRRVASECAREEILSLHIPQERLDAARFDGLTVLVLDRSGQELPVYIPPNYIEGFRQAAAGQVGGQIAGQVSTTPTYSSSTPYSSGTVHSGPTYQEPSYSPPTYSPPQTAACPVGTTSQPDGTCLTTSSSGTYSGYPTR